MPLSGGGSTGISLDTVRNSDIGKLLNFSSGLAGPMTCCSFGTSHMTGLEGFAATLQYALARYHDAYLTFDHRKVLTSKDDATVVANRGDAYATSQATSTHMIGPQLTQFNTDVAAGRRFDIMFTDGGLYNDNPADQAALDLAMTRTLTVITAFFNPAANNGSAAVVYGTFGLNPTLMQSWAAMWRRQEVLSGGRIRFVDTARVLINPGASNATTWAAGDWRGGSSGTFGSATSDGTHLSFSGARYSAQALWPVLADICPRTYPRGGSYVNALYDPATRPNGDVLGSGAAMLGSQGLDFVTGGGAFPGTIVGAGGQSGDNNTWALSWSGGITPTPSITSTADGNREQTLALSGDAASFANIRFAYKPVVSSVNNGQAARRFMAGIEVELVGVTGVCNPTLYFNTTSPDLLPVPDGTQADGYADGASEVLRMRFLRTIPLTGANPIFGVYIPFRAKNGVAGSIKLRKAWWQLVEKEA